MNDTVYKKIEITGTSRTSIEDAVNKALERTSRSIRNMKWFEISELRGQIENNHTKQWQVTLKIGFDIEE